MCVSVHACVYTCTCLFKAGEWPSVIHAILCGNTHIHTIHVLNFVG